MKRPGYYVEGRYFRDHLHQARARAAVLAEEYGRGVKVVFVGHDDPIPTLVCEVFNSIRRTLRANGSRPEDMYTGDRS